MIMTHDYVIVWFGCFGKALYIKHARIELKRKVVV